jgi:nicotinamide-nucleotide amidase
MMPSLEETVNTALARPARELFETLSKRGLRLVCAESCTGGMVTATLTDLAGSSAVLWGGVAAYSNECKVRALRVAPETIAEFGAVSREVARAMADGALELSGGPEAGGAAVALAVTGIAGPEGGSAEKPVGLVWFGFRLGRSSSEESRIFPGDRRAIRESAARFAMERLAALVGELATGRY